MGKTRVCGKICHNAKREKCGCWCRGLFHGVKGSSARDAFRESFGDDPKGERTDLDRWQEGMRRACATRGETYVPVSVGQLGLKGVA